MKTDLTVDVVISGCVTRCRHCYVDGGPGETMPFHEYMRCLDVLEEVFKEVSRKGLQPYLWLDYEPLLHPRICDILSTTKQRFGKYFDMSCFPSTGIPLATRSDWREILNCLGDTDTSEFLFTLHGPEDIHDKAVSRRDALKLQSLAISRVKEHGFKTQMKVVVSNDMLRHFDATMDIATSLDPDNRRAEVPVYQPISRLRQFERIRATLEDAQPFLQPLSDFCNIGKWRQYWENADDCTERKVYRDVITNPDSYTFTEMETKMTPWIFTTITPDLILHYGDAGTKTQEIGELGTDEPETITKRILGLKPNYLFSGLYNLNTLPAPAEIASNFGDPQSGKLYASAEDVFFRWIDLMQKKQNSP